MFKSVGFAGGGRVTRIILNGFRKAGVKFEKIVVSDISLENLEKLKSEFPEICISYNDNLQPFRQQLVFISLHPPVIMDLIKEIHSVINSESLLVSLAPKITIAKLTEELNGFNRIARMIPNAPSVIGEGYNPVHYSSSITEAEKAELNGIFAALGKAPEVSESKLEAYAVLTAMGPTYFWFQLLELQKLSEGFGLSAEEFQAGITGMLEGSLKTMFSGMSADEILDLVPVRPIGEEEERIKEIFNTRLTQVFVRIKP